MSYTAVSDVIVPSVFSNYVIELSSELSAFWQSGIISTVAELNENATQGGSQVNMPFWDDLAGDDQLLDDSTDLVVREVTSDQDVAVWHGRALVYGANDLAATLAGDDPMRVVAQRVAAKWVRRQNRLLVSTLKGAMDALELESPDVNVLNICALSGAAANIDGAAFIDATQLMGENKDRLVGVAMHSAVEAALAKQDLIEFIRDSEGRVVLSSFMNKRVVVDDQLEPDVDGCYTTYLFGEGAIGYSEGSPKVPTETDRNPLINGGQEFIVNRRHFVLHPRGIKWDPGSGVPAKQTPSNAELEDSANWTRVWTPENIRIVAFKHKIA